MASAEVQTDDCNIAYPDPDLRYIGVLVVVGGMAPTPCLSSSRRISRRRPQGEYQAHHENTTCIYPAPNYQIPPFQLHRNATTVTVQRNIDTSYLKSVN